MGGVRYMRYPGRLFAALLLCLWPALAKGHGTGYGPADGLGARSLEYYYSSGDPMAYAKTLVYAPDDGETEYQNGRTDRRGRFAFVPDMPGTWRVVVSDGQGHRVGAEVDVPPENGLGPHSGKPVRGRSATPLRERAAGRMRGPGIALGLSLILNLALGGRLLRGGRRSRA